MQIKIEKYSQFTLDLIASSQIQQYIFLFEIHYKWNLETIEYNIFQNKEELMTNEDKDLRELLIQQDEKLSKALVEFDSKEKYEHKQGVYNTVTEMIKFMKQHLKDFEGGTLLKQQLLKLTFLVGQSGGGKSTLLNYIVYGDNGLKIKNSDGEITTKDTSVAKIGGDKSTTLIPNLYSGYLDCAGQEESDGILAQIINSLIKKRIAENTEEAKIVFVTSYSGLKASGNYGLAFKSALDRNAQFLNDISYFKNSIGFVVTGTSDKQDAPKNTLQAIQKIQTHSNMRQYSEVIKQILQNKYIQTFSKPSSRLDVDDIYAPPKWNQNQKQKIISMINSIPFTKIPQKDFFNTSSSPRVRETMRKTIQIVEAKATNIIYQAVKSAIPLNIFSVELKPFDKYIKGLIVGIVTSFKNYCKILQWNNYLKIQINTNEINQILSQIQFLSQFAQQDTQKQKCKKKNWNSPNLTKIFDDVSKNVTDILKNRNNFSQFLNMEKIRTSSTSSTQSSVISSKMKALYDKYKQLKQMEVSKLQQHSIYYKDVTKKQFSHKISVPYKQKEKYVITENYQDTENQIQSYQDDETKYRPVTKYRKQKKNIFAGRTKTIIDKIPYNETYNANQGKTRTEYRKKQVDAPIRTGVFHMATFGLATLGKALFTGDPLYHDTEKYSVQVPLEPDWQTRQKYIQSTRVVDEDPHWIEYDAPYYEMESYKEKVTKYRLVPTKVTKQRPVEKEREVQKFRQQDVYQDLIVRQFDKQKYDDDMKKLNGQIEKLRKQIKHKIDAYPKGVTGSFEADKIISLDDYESKYEDLMGLWQKAEYGAYFALNPTNSLGSVDIETIEKRVAIEQ